MCYLQIKEKRADERTRTADLLITSELLSGRRSGQRRASSFPCPSHHFTAVAVSLGTTSVNGVRNCVGFVEKNIRTDLDAMQEMVEINSQSTPTTVIDGEVIVGFDKERISQKLEL